MRKIYNGVSAKEKTEERSFRPAARRRKQSIVSAFRHSHAGALHPAGKSPVFEE